MSPVTPKFSGVAISRFLKPDGTLYHYGLKAEDSSSPRIGESEVLLDTYQSSGQMDTQSLGSYEQAGQLTQTLTAIPQKGPGRISPLSLPTQAKRLLTSLINQLAEENKLSAEEADTLKSQANKTTEVDAIRCLGPEHTIWEFGVFR